MKTILLTAFLALACVALSAAPPPPMPAVANAFTTNKPPNAVSNTVPILQYNYIEVSPTAPGPATNYWGESFVRQNIDGLVSATNLVNASVNVRSWATGDGATDDTDAIQDAIDLVGANSGELFFPPGRYRLTSTVTITNTCKLRGIGATILIPDGTPAFTLNNFTNGLIQGMTFVGDSSASGPATAIYGQTNSLSGVQIIYNRFTRARLILRDAEIFDTVAGNKDAKIIGNSWDGEWGMTSFIGDVSQCIDMRGFSDAVVQGNVMNVSNEERFAHFSSCYNLVVSGNIFTSTQSTNATVAIDFFADCRNTSFLDNKFTMTNTICEVVLYGKASGLGPGSVGMIESQHTGIDMSHNVIDLSTSSANAIGIAIYGPWGQPDETLPESTCVVNGNQVLVRAAASNNPNILVRGFSGANIIGNIAGGTNINNFKHSIEADNCETVNIIGNQSTFGRITVQGVSYSPQAIQYEKMPVNITIADNTIKAFKNLGGIWISQCTNLANLNVTGNTIKTVDSSSSANGLIYLYQSPGITNVLVSGTLGFSDNGNYYVKEASTTVERETVVDNFWQANGVVLSVNPATTNIVIDFKREQFQSTFYLADDTNANLHFSATNCLSGKAVFYRLQAGATNRNLTYDSSFVVHQGTPTMVGSNRTVSVIFTSWSTNCGSANVTVMPWLQGADDMPLVFNNLKADLFTRDDSSAIVSFNSDNSFGALTPFQHASTNVGAVGWIASTDTMGFVARDLGTRTWSVDNSGNASAAGYVAANTDMYLFTNNRQFYGRNAANTWYFPMMRVGTDDVLHLGSSTNEVTTGWALNVGGGGSTRTDPNGGKVILDVGGRMASTSQALGAVTSDDQVITVSGNTILLSSDDATPANRTILLNNSGVYGQALRLIVVAGGVELADDSAISGGAGTVKLSSTWSGLASYTLSLYFEGTNWIETARSNN